MPTLYLTSSAEGATHFVGRELELARVQALLNEAALDSGGVLLVEGEIGAGKSRFLAQCARLKRSIAAASARCGASVGASDGLTAQLAATFHPGASASVLLAFLRTRSRRRATALFLDDLHLASPPELRLLSTLMSLAAQVRLAVVGCYLADAGRGGFERELLRWLEAGAQHARLQPLNDAETELLMRGTIFRTGQSVGADALRAMLHTAQGNPRIAIEVARQAADVDAGMPVIAPSALAEMALLREALPALDFNVLSLCSVVGEVFRDEWIVNVARRRADAVAKSLQAGVEMGVLAEIRERPGWLRFRAVAVREALYASIVSLKRRLTHERVAAYLSAETEADAVHCAVIAEQWHAAGRHDEAAEWLTRAADEFESRGVFRAAAESYARAIGHLTHGSERWYALAHKLRRCYRNLAEWERMIPIVESMLSLERIHHDRDAEEGLLWDLFFAHLNDGDLGTARAVAERIARVVLPERPHRYSIAVLIVAYALSYRGQLEDARKLLAGIDAEVLSDPETRLRECIARASVDALHQPLEDSLRLIDRAAEIARGLGIRGTVLCWSDGVQIALRYGDIQAARAYLSRAETDAARSAGEVNDAKWLVHIGRIRVALFAGDLRDARNLLYASFAWRDFGKHSQALIAGLGTLVGMRIGDLALVDALFDQALLAASVDAGNAESCGLLLPGYAEVMQARMMTKDLQTLLQRCVASELVDPYAWIPYCASRFGTAECGELALEQLQRYMRAAVAPAAAAHIALLNATTARRRGRHIVACEFARDAAARYRRLGWRLAEAAALELAGNYTAASNVYAACGAVVDVDRLAAAQSRKARRAPFGARLTTRELEVARLALRRRSNGEIARALQISVRTVHHHVESVLSKLGIHSRHQLTPEHLEVQRPG